jgi:hypothetical protein
MRGVGALWAAIAPVLLASGCAVLGEPEGAPRKETILAVTESHQLVLFNAGTPGLIASRKPLYGLEAGDAVVAMGYRGSGALYALTRGGRLYAIDANAATARQIGTEPMAVSLDGAEFGLAFDPVVDRFRVMSDRRQNLRVHPDTAAVFDTDPDEPGIQTDRSLTYFTDDPHEGGLPRIVALASMYNREERATTLFAIDSRQDALVTVGTRGGYSPAVSPNSGRLFTVGALGLGEVERAALDVAGSGGVAYAAYTGRGAKASRLYLVDLTSGKATLLGAVAAGEALRAIAIAR